MDSPPSNTTKDTETPWVELFEWSSGSFYGSVNTLEKAAELIDGYSYSTSTFYIPTRATKQFGDCRLTSDSGKWYEAI